MSADTCVGGGPLTGIKETLETISVSEDYIDMPLDIATRGLESAELPQHRELCQKVIEKTARSRNSLPQRAAKSFIRTISGASCS